MDKNAIQKNNEAIKRSILVSQMQDAKGFKVFEEDLDEMIKSVQFQDIRLLTDINKLSEAKGYLQALENIKYYLFQQKQFALKPLINEDTGEEEILNKKKQ